MDHCSFDLLRLPRDVIALFLHKYFEPVSALRCLRTCKQLNMLGDRSKIIRRVLISNSEIEFEKQLSQIFICPECSTNLPSKEALNNHLRKHVSFRRRGKVMVVYKPLVLETCYLCSCPTSNFTNHHCRVRTRSCFNSSASYIYPNFESLCRQTEYYCDDPNREHICYSRCKFCKEVFRSGYTNDSDGHDGCYLHFEKCPHIVRASEVYRFKGRRTDEEFEEFVASVKDVPNIVEAEFEQEYLRWKGENVQITSYVQKPYNAYMVYDNGNNGDGN